MKHYLPNIVRAAEAMAPLVSRFFDEIATASSPSATSRWHVKRTPGVLGGARLLQAAICEIQDAIALAEDLVETDTKHRFYILQARLDEAAHYLASLAGPRDDSVLFTIEPGKPGAVLGAVPRRVDRLIRRELYSQRKAVILTSATLRAGGSFDYYRRMLGASEAGHLQVGTPFDTSRQALLYVPQSPILVATEHLVDLLTATGGRALILCNTMAELAELKACLRDKQLRWKMLFERDAERALLIRRFRADVTSVLVGTSFWEGIDARGKSFSCVIVPRLPFPADDPLLLARQDEARKDGLCAFSAVDIPEMALRLKQGFGRLIRTATDKGVFALLDTSFCGSPYESAVKSALPYDSECTSDLGRIKDFLSGV